MKQIEIPIEAERVNLAITCKCLKGKDRGNLVVLRPGLDRRFLMGECGHCGKKYFRAA